MIFPLISFLLATPTQKTTNRQFQFVEYGESFSSTKNDDRPTISCDGRIPGGVTLELTHWNGNETPDALYQDTSTGMALKLAENDEYSKAMTNAWVLNNHFDTDGLLSVWACLEPQLALQHAELLVQGAEAGDFGEWSSDLGIKLDSALLQLYRHQCQGNDEAAFQKAFQELPNLLEDLQTTGGKSYEKLWKPGFDAAIESWDLLLKKEATLEPFNEEIVILKRPTSVPSISPFALHRGLVEHGLDASVKRVLHVTTEATTNDPKTALSSYQYEKAGHGWVNKLVQRPLVPPVDSKKLVEKLNALGDEDRSNQWKAGGSSLVSICQTVEPTRASVEAVAAALSKHDEGLLK